MGWAEIPDGATIVLGERVYSSDALQRFRKRLAAYDRHLDVEDLGDHLAVIDRSRPRSHIRVSKGPGIMGWKTVYDRVLHLKPCQPLDGGVINELRARNMNRWARAADFKHHMNQQLEKADAEPEKHRAEMTQELAHESFSYIKGNPKVTVPGNRDGGVYVSNG